MARDCNTVTPKTNNSLASSSIGNGKTIEVINGETCFFIVVPCEMPGKRDTYEPIYRVKLNEFGGVECGTWQCAECRRIFYTRRSWARHKGMKSNIMGDCTSEVRKALGVKNAT